MVDKSTVKALCDQEHLKYRELEYDIYEIENGKTEPIQIWKYTLPFEREKEMTLLAVRPALKRKNRLAETYRHIGLSATQNYTVAKKLDALHIRSAVRYAGAYHIKSEREAASVADEVYLAAEPLCPLYVREQAPDMTIGTAVDIARRLLAICIDLDAVGITHRNINAHTVFFDRNGRIQLGGFGYSVNKNAPGEIIPLLNSAHAAPQVEKGEAGDISTDMYSIASLLGCLLNGQGTEETFNGKLPLMPSLFYEALSLGFSLDANNVMAFRAKLNQIYKDGKSLFWDVPVTQLYQMRLTAGPGNPQEKTEETRGTHKEPRKKYHAHRREKKAKRTRETQEEPQNSQNTVNEHAAVSEDDPLAYQEDQEADVGVDVKDKAQQKNAAEGKNTDRRGLILSYLIGAAASALVAYAGYFAMLQLGG